MFFSTKFILLLFISIFKVFGEIPQDYHKIVDGQQTDISKFPYQVALLYGGKLTCGGSIINSKWILTAAHCTFGRKKELFTIRAGSSSASSGGEVYKIQNIQEHPKFSFSTIDYDIALIELQDDLVFTDTIKLIELAEYEPPVKSKAVVTGWGIVSEAYPISSPILRTVEVPIVRRLTCNFRYFFKITDRMICAGYTLGGMNICKGDSGGPLVYQGKQIGIVSWGAGCARAISPGVFTNVPVLIDYIRAVTRLDI